MMLKTSKKINFYRELSLICGVIYKLCEKLLYSQQALSNNKSLKNDSKSIDSPNNLDNGILNNAGNTVET